MIETSAHKLLDVTFTVCAGVYVHARTISGVLARAEKSIRESTNVSGPLDYSKYVLYTLDITKVVTNSETQYTFCLLFADAKGVIDYQDSLVGAQESRLDVQEK